MSEMGVRGLAAFNQKVAEANAAGTPLMDPFQEDEVILLEELAFNCCRCRRICRYDYDCWEKG
jgi:hypothetical protein